MHSTNKAYLSPLPSHLSLLKKRNKQTSNNLKSKNYVWNCCNLQRKRADARVETEKALRMSQKIRHRGPDWSGISP